MNLDSWQFTAQIKRKTFWSKRYVTIRDRKLMYQKSLSDSKKKVFYLESLKYSVKVDSAKEDYVFCFYKEGKVTSYVSHTANEDLESSRV